MFKITKSKVATLLFSSVLLLTGCGLLGGEGKNNEIDPPQDITYLEDGESLESNTANESIDQEAEAGQEQADVETMMRELYLFDKNGLVVSQTLELPKVEGVAKQALEYLVQNGPVQEILPNGFQAVLPPDTQVLGVNIEGNTIVADFSNEFINYSPENEMKILQAITWTLTQFDNIEIVKIRINGHDQTVMPVNSTPIGNGVSRADGINLDTTEVVDITSTHSVTVYYLAENDGSTYYVPVTQRVDNSVNNDFVAVVNALVNGPSYSSALLSEFNTDAKLITEPKYENGKLTLNFNEAILGSFDENKNIISKHVVDTLVLSLTEQKGVDSVSILVNGEANLINEEGNPISETVTRPETVNTGSF